LPIASDLHSLHATPTGTLNISAIVLTSTEK